MISSYIYHRAWLLTIVVFVTMSAALLASSAGSMPYRRHALHNSPGASDSSTLPNSYGELPLSFEANAGQVNSNVKFLSHGHGYTLFLTTAGPVFAFDNQKHQDMLRLQLMGAAPASQVVGLDELPGRTNYFIGNDPQQWHTNVPTFARVIYQHVYPGVNLVFYGSRGHLEYDFVIQPGVNPSIIRLHYEGGGNVQIDTQGNLVLSLQSGQLFQPRPRIYQQVGGTRSLVSGHYVLLGTNLVGFEVTSYDAARPLVIDPVLTYSTYLGGSGDDQAFHIAIDSAGNAYVTGYTYSTNFPTKSALQGNNLGAGDVFVTKLSASGNALVYSTYLGGSGFEVGYSIAVDSGGDAYVVGYTGSKDFPIAHALQSTLKGDDDAFVTKLNASGNALVYSTYLGGSNGGYGQGIALDSAGDAYVTGYTESTDFPTVNPFQSKNHTPLGLYTGFISKLNASGSALLYSTYLGGSDYDQPAGIAVDSAGNAYVTGTTGSGDFPTVNAIQKTDHHPGIGTGFISKLNASGNALVFSTFLGGSMLDLGQSIAVDKTGQIYVTGATGSKDFPTKNPFQSTNRGGHETGFVSKLNAAGNVFVYSTYLGGTGHDLGNGIAVDSAGNAYITGYTDSTDFPVAHAIQSTKRAFADVFISEFNANGSALVFSTYLGGSSYDDQGNSIAVDSAGNMYITGFTQSKTFPTKNPFQATFGGGSYDAFVTRIAP